MSTLVYLAPTILKISKIIIYEFWYDFGKPKYREKTKLCYLDTNSFIVYIKTENIYVDITQYVETRFDTSNYELERPLSKEKKSNWINERWIRSETNDRISYIETKKMQLYNWW